METLTVFVRIAGTDRQYHCGGQSGRDSLEAFAGETTVLLDVRQSTPEDPQPGEFQAVDNSTAATDLQAEVNWPN